MIMYTRFYLNKIIVCFINRITLESYFKNTLYFQSCMFNRKTLSIHTVGVVLLVEGSSFHVTVKMSSNHITRVNQTLLITFRSIMYPNPHTFL